MAMYNAGELAGALVVVAIAVFSVLAAASYQATYSIFAYKRHQDSIHDTDAIRTDELFSKDGEQSIVLDFDSTGSMRDRAAESSFSSIPPVDMGSTRLTLIGLQAQGVGLGSRTTDGTSHEGNHLYHFESLSAKPLISETRSSMFDAWDLLRLWSSNMDGAGANFRSWRISTSILGSFIAPRKLNEDATLSKNRAFFFRPHFIEVWDCISTVQTRSFAGGGTEVVCYFGTLPFKFFEGNNDSASDANAEAGDESGRTQHIRQFSPLKDHFHRIICSKSSASSLERPNGEVAIMLVVIDILRAAIECWIIHVTLLSQRVSDMAAVHARQDPAANFESFQRLQAIPRDLQAAIDLVFDAVTAELNTTKHQVATAALKKIRLNANAKLLTVRHAVDDLGQRFSFFAEMRAAHVHRDQASSVKRLTLLASIFLPISLASGLLSMGTRAVDLGILWLDFLGISLFLITTVIAAYQIMRLAHLMQARWEASIAQSYRAARKQWMVTTVELPLFLVKFAWVQLRSLSSSRLLLSLCKFIIPIPLLVFLGVSMFDSMDVGLEYLPEYLTSAGLVLSMAASMIMVHTIWSSVRSGNSLKDSILGRV